MIFWYSAIGIAVFNAAAANSMLERVRRARSLPRPRRVIWKASKGLAKQICAVDRTNPVDWFTGGCGDLQTAWQRLDDIPGIGPKIASFIMREFSFLRDYSRGSNRLATSWRVRRDRRWFDALSPQTQCLCVPVDNNVFAGARRYRVNSLFNRYTVAEIYASPELHHDAAMAITTWSRARGFDPRDVDVYWYRYERGYINRDGTRAEG